MLCNNHIVRKMNVGKELACEKDPFYVQNKKTILRLANSSEILRGFPTKTNPTLRLKLVHVSFPRQPVKAR